MLIKIKDLRLRLILFITILFTISIFFIEGSSVDIIWENEHLHIVLESLGSFCGILVSLLLFSDQKRFSFDLSTVILGLISMSIIDLYHTMSNIGPAFIFLHTFAGFLGGIGLLLFPLINLLKIKLHISKVLLIAVIIIVAILGYIIIKYEEYLPIMESDRGFSNIAIYLNIFNGVMFLIGSIYFMILDYRKKSIVLLLFIITSLLISLSSFTFMISEMWCTTWWTWHFLRFFANSILIIYIFIYIDQGRKLTKIQNKEIKEINKKLNNYSYTISHDLKEPIRSIRSFSEFLQEDYIEILDSEGKDYLARIITASTKMANMIDELLLLSRISRNDIPFENISLNNILTDVLQTLEVNIKDNNILIEHENLPTIYCQESWMKLVFLNLISNAIKYRDEGKELSTIFIKCKKHKNFLEINFIDNGIGIEKDQHEKVFGLFRRAYTKKNKTGSGAGLAIVSEVISQHGGTVYIQESTPGVGTNICLNIPEGDKKL